MKRFLPIILLALLTAAGIWWFAGRSTAAGEGASVAAYLSAEETAGFARATEPGAIEFPRDFGPHDDYQTEWWYYTGNLETADGRPFGYQFTIFRRAIAPPDPTVDGTDKEGSSWRTNQVYFAHFAVSDIASGDFYAFETFSRGAAGLAGATAVPYHVWIENWEVREQPDGTTRMFATAGEVTLELSLIQTQPPVLHGDRGLSVKGDAPGNASYYYSLINQRSTGSLTIGDDTYAVSGHSWKDHEYSTSALDPGAIGWDWFSLQFDDEGESEAGHALMLFEIRREDGSIEDESGGSWILPDSSVVKLTREDVQIDVLDTWRSPTSGAEYPAGWRIQIPKIGLDITGEPLMSNQELNVSTIYWEGAVRFTGTLNGRPITATGYVELTGYGESMEGRI